MADRAISAVESLPQEQISPAISYPGGICPERSRLLATMTEAASAQCNGAAAAFIVAGTNNPAEFTRVQIRARAQRAESVRASNEYRRHVAEHGC